MPMAAKAITRPSSTTFHGRFTWFRERWKTPINHPPPPDPSSYYCWGFFPDEIAYTDGHRPSRKSLVSHRADGHPGRRYTGA
eukprot:4831616-Pyramimonas_sp.AAC.1